MRTLSPFCRCKKEDLESLKLRSSNTLDMSSIETNGHSTAKCLYQPPLKCCIQGHSDLDMRPEFAFQTVGERKEGFH